MSTAWISAIDLQEDPCNDPAETISQSQIITVESSQYSAFSTAEATYILKRSTYPEMHSILKHTM